MHLVQKFLYALACTFLSLSPLQAKQDYTVEPQHQALEQAFHVSNMGVLKQKENGFVYLDVSNDFIKEIVPLLEIPGEIRPRPTASRSIGAHISVFHEQEAITPRELGCTFAFEVKEIRSFTLHTRDGLKKLWVIAVESPELEALRVSYGLSPKLKGYDFHITLGKQMPTAPAGYEQKTCLSPYNFDNDRTLGLEEEGDFYIVENKELIATAEKVNQIGQLKLKNNGYVYLDVSNEFVERTVALLDTEGEFEPTATSPKKLGAHISVFYEDEMIGKGIWNLSEAGDWFTFEVRQLRYVQLGNGRKLWVLAVDCPALQRLRTNYGLKPKLQGHDFHITLGYETEASAIDEAA